MGNKHPNSSNEKQVISQQSDLPDVLIFEEILTRLPIKSILRFKSVSKQWYSTLSSSNFVNVHFKKSPFSDPCAPANALIIQNGYDYYVFYYNDVDDQIPRNFEVVKPDNTEFLVEREGSLVGSCNGLVCISVQRGKYFFLWNPVTCKVNQYTPQDEYLNRFEEAYRITYGFGYVSSIDDYIIVAIRMVINQENSSNTKFALIFSLRENMWRKIDLDNNNNIRFGFEHGVYVSEKLYWRASSDQTEKLVSFDLAAKIKRFDVIDVVDWNKTEKLGVSKGCLHKFNWNTFKLDVLEPPPAIVKSIELPEGLFLHMCSQINGFTKTDKLFVTEWPSNYFEYRFFNVRTLGIVDTSTTPLQYTHLLNFDKVPFRIAGYVPSLVSPFPSEHS